MRIFFDRATEKKLIKDVFLALLRAAGEKYEIVENREDSDLVVFCGLGFGIIAMLNAEIEPQDGKRIAAIKERMEAAEGQGKKILLMSGNEESDVRWAFKQVAEVPPDFLFMEKPSTLEKARAFLKVWDQ